jgi:hypothetical protein
VKAGRSLLLLSIFALLPIVATKPSTIVFAAGGGCLIGDDKGDTWVNLYQEDQHGNKGKQIWHDVLFHKGEQLQISDGNVGPNLRMRYDYKNAPGDQYHGNVGFTCRNGEKIVLQ